MLLTEMLPQALTTLVPEAQPCLDPRDIYAPLEKKLKQRNHNLQHV